jgi:hypothetical protein
VGYVPHSTQVAGRFLKDVKDLPPLVPIGISKGDVNKPILLKGEGGTGFYN